MTGQDFRAVMRHWATGITLITCEAPKGLHGITVNSFTSLSLDPPLALVCIDQKAKASHEIPAAGHFVVNFLGQDSQEVSDRFAGRRPELADPFTGLSIGRTPAGHPMLPQALAYLDCTLRENLPGGDHLILVGDVISATVLRSGDPLLFYGGTYRQLQA